MPLAIPGFPENVVPLAYRTASAIEHWFEPPFSEGSVGLIHPGPSHYIVLVVAAADGHSMRYDINSDTTLVVKDKPLPTPEQADIKADVPQLRAHDLLSFAVIAEKLTNGTTKRAARATWSPGHYITVDAAHAPHFTTEASRLWAFRSDDLRARDWRVVD